MGTWAKRFLANSFRSGRLVGPLHIDSLSGLQLR